MSSARHLIKRRVLAFGYGEVCDLEMKEVDNYFSNATEAIGYVLGV